ncbi:MAG: hypothetical protein J7J15_02235, partial [Candidatus Aenigmarchaeota archaeon]|nr:hypothetical protein [Candidatus Aenigmarchaeota archaeon]
FHIIPRFEGDNGLPMQGLVRMEVKKEDLPKIAEKIKKEIENTKVFKESGKSEEQKKEKSEEIKEIKEESTKSSEREWQEFNLEEQDKAPNYSEARREEFY